MKISDFVRINDSLRTRYNVYRGGKLVDIIEKDYLTQDNKQLPEATRRINCLMDTNGYVESIYPWYGERTLQTWIHVDVQIGTHDYPDRL